MSAFAAAFMRAFETTWALGVSDGSKARCCGSGMFEIPGPLKGLYEEEPGDGAYATARSNLISADHAPNRS